jgi:hypothetical protein
LYRRYKKRGEIKMECPIKNHAYETTGIKGKHATRECIKEECAWWDFNHEKCIIVGICIELKKAGKKENE